MVIVQDYRSFVSAPKDVFGYFDTQLGHPEWTGRYVLDFGGNIGNLLVGSPIEHERYWCVDVSRAAVEEGRRCFPRANWVHYDRYNFQYNPEGRIGLPVPVLGPPFDYVVCFSVFTHTSPAEMLDLVGQLRAQLAPAGTLLFTFDDLTWALPGDAPGTQLRTWLRRAKTLRKPHLDVEALVAATRGAAWCTLIDDEELHVESDGSDTGCRRGAQYATYYRSEYLRELLPGVRILEPVVPHTHLQHCAVVTGPA